MTLKPCPFCGGEAQMNDIGLCEVFCIDCQASTHLYQLPEQAAAAWNKRQGEDDGFDPSKQAAIINVANQMFGEPAKQPIPAPPVVEWVEADNVLEADLMQVADFRSGDYHGILSKWANSGGFFIEVWHSSVIILCKNYDTENNARLAAEVAILRHWAENLNK